LTYNPLQGQFSSGPASGSKAPAQSIYKVRPGDNDVLIAKRLGVTGHALRAANPGVVWTRLKIGATLKVPGTPVTAVKASATKCILNLPPLRPPMRPKLVKSPLVRYVVREGDNDWNIADHLAVRVSDLHRLNPGANFARLKPGDVLYAPGPGRILPTRLVDLPALSPPRPNGPGVSNWAMLDADRVGVRVAPSNSAKRITLVDKFTTAKVIAAADGWYRLRFQHGTTGWVRGDMLVASEMPTWAVSRPAPRTRYYASSTRPSVSYRRSYASRPPRYSADYRRPGTTGNSVVDYAAKFQGVRYRYGGESTAGFDCSGFTRYVYKLHGVSLPHNAAAQSRTGKAVSKDQIKPGDLVFFKSARGGSRIGHAGIAIGGGKFIHASSGKGRVRIDSYTSGHYSSRFAGARTFQGGSTASKSKPAETKPKGPEPKEPEQKQSSSEE
jgi:cell wall-associated NlpC family hydrolase